MSACGCWLLVLNPEGSPPQITSMKSNIIQLTSPERRQIDPDLSHGGFTNGFGAGFEALCTPVDVFAGSLDGLVVEGPLALACTQRLEARAISHHAFMVGVAVVAFVAGVLGVTHFRYRVNQIEVARRRL